jgi:hypothetical protein
MRRVSRRITRTPRRRNLGKHGLGIEWSGCPRPRVENSDRCRSNLARGVVPTNVPGDHVLWALHPFEADHRGRGYLWVPSSIAVRAKDADLFAHHMRLDRLGATVLGHATPSIWTSRSKQSRCRRCATLQARAKADDLLCPARSPRTNASPRARSRRSCQRCDRLNGRSPTRSPLFVMMSVTSCTARPQCG